MASLRARLAAWYAAAFAVLLTAFAVYGFAFLSRASLAQADESLGETLAAVSRVLDAELAEGAHGDEAAAEVARELRFRDLSVLILARPRAAPASGADVHVHGSEPTPPALLALLREVDAGRVPGRGAVLRTAGHGEQALRLAAARHDAGTYAYVVGVAMPLRARHRLLRAAALAAALGIPALLLVASLGGYWLARRGLAPVVAMGQQARRIGATTLHGRVPVADPNDELGRLASAFNDLLARLEAAFEQQRRFVADASHELRTPVAIVHGEASLALARDDRSPAELRDALLVVREEAARLRAIVDDLFLLARADAGDRTLASGELYLADLAGDEMRAVRSLAAARGVSLELAPAADGDPLPFHGDPVLLARLLRNLLDNAVKHTPSGGRVTVSLAHAGAWYRIVVADDGPGIPPAERERVFERFYRSPDGAAARDLGTARRTGVGDPASAGLGLPIARWIAEVHGGRAFVADVWTGSRGAAFVVELPAPPADATANIEARETTASNA